MKNNYFIYNIIMKIIFVFIITYLPEMVNIENVHL
jgi:hypothetical protein